MGRHCNLYLERGFMRLERPRAAVDPDLGEGLFQLGNVQPYLGRPFVTLRCQCVLEDELGACAPEPEVDLPELGGGAAHTELRAVVQPLRLNTPAELQLPVVLV